MHLVIATRADPSLPLTHFRGKGMMLEINTDDLRFTLDETTALLKEMQSPELSVENVNALHGRTEGWVVGLKMAVLAMRQQKDIPRFLTSFSGSQRYIMDYLLEEVLRKQSEEVQDFLLKTSVLERLTAPLCDFITGYSDSQDIILKLEHANLFIVPLDELRQWYRYEHLFADLLRHQLEVTFGVEKVAELHQKASQWHEDHGFLEETMYHALEAKDWEKAVKFFMDNHLNYYLKGMSVTLLNWLQKIPEEVIYHDSRLSYLYGFMFYSTDQPNAATSVANRMEQSAENDNVIHQGAIATLRGFIAYSRGDFKLSLELGERALSLFPSNESLWRAGPSAMVGNIYLQRGLLKEAELLFNETYELSQQGGNDYLSARAISRLAEVSSMRGKLHLAAEQHRKVIESSGPSPATGLSYEGLSAVMYEWNQIGAAVTNMQKAIELGLIEEYQEYVTKENAMLARFKLAQGDEAGAIKTMETACLIAHNNILPRIRAEHAIFHILIALRQDNLATALEWGRKLTEDAGVLPFYYNWVPVRLLIAEGKKSAALEKLQNLYRESEQRGAQSNLIVLRICQALAADTVESAIEFLADALRMAEPEGYIRTFVDEGRLLAPLLRKALSQGITPEFTGKLLTIIKAEEQRRQKTKGAAMLLSKRELEILRLLVGESSNKQIADRLNISLSTVKTHVHGILEKMNARDRSQAVSQARELKLI